MKVDLNLSHGMFEIFVIIRKHRLLFSSKKNGGQKRGYIFRP